MPGRGDDGDGEAGSESFSELEIFESGPSGGGGGGGLSPNEITPMYRWNFREFRDSFPMSSLARGPALAQFLSFLKFENCEYASTDVSGRCSAAMINSRDEISERGSTFTLSLREVFGIFHSVTNI